MKKDLTKIHCLPGLRARHIPYELTDGGWEKNPEHEEEVTLSEYYYRTELVGQTTVICEGIIFIREDYTFGRDRLDSFIIKEGMNIIEKLQSRRLRRKIEKRTDIAKQVAEELRIQGDLLALKGRILGLRNGER